MTDATTRLIAQLSDAEKVALTAGADAWSTTAVERLGIPALRLGDGPHGVRRPREGSGMSMFDSHPATCFPTAASLGASWDPTLVEEVGVALGREAASHGIGVLLGPGVNLKRTPTGGRDFEYFSEDPCLTSRLGSAWVRGVQSTGVGASLKHFAANNTEQRRYGIDAVVDERALRELYLACFERIVIDEQPATVMAAYNRLNGTHCTENGPLVTGILREEWGFAGAVVSDWGASWDRTLSIPAGTDLSMPGLGRRDDAYVLGALRSGVLQPADLDASVGRILRLVSQHVAVAEAAPAADLDAHHDLARRAAAAGTVLLQNDGVLPLAAGLRLAVIGAFAEDPRFQGAGSSHVVPTRVDTLLEALAVAQGVAAVDYAPGYDRHHDSSSDAQLAEARAAAGGADVAVVVVGLPESFETEGVDRTHLRLPESHERVIDEVVRANPNTVVVLQNGSPVELPWRHRVRAVLEGYLGGQAGGSALADVLLGAAEPGGRLAETFPERWDEHPVAALPNGPETCGYRESLYVGYRYFDSAGERVAFPFGHGLSYTRFEWSDARVETTGAGESAGAVVRVVLTNTGKREGSEVVQVYVHDAEASVFRPEQELRGFAKVQLRPGESREVHVRLDRRAFSFWSPAAHGWVVEAGRFEVRVGRSSRDIRWRGEVELEGAVAGAGDDPEVYRHPSRTAGFPEADFAQLLGHPVAPGRAPRPGQYGLDTAVRDMQRSRAGRMLFRLVKSQGLKAIGAPEGMPVDAVAGEVVAQLTFRMFPTVSGGAVGRRGTLRLLRLLNLLARPRRRTRAARRGSGASVPPDRMG
ncbi:glycoside hydrolase family 3 C-terminal domain-containing protein [Herbiconiux liangxiaofengii]|uniref:glycoside hydrolase family 3 C-terminal domain-containing protein n=1 Tax=Herbiconiux liangxiaofengii TaxID=3342795 RepID=UPI0035B8D2B5